VPNRVVCDACEGRRYKPEALEIRYKGLAIDQVLELTVAEAVEQFSEPRQLAEILEPWTRSGLAISNSARAPQSCPGARRSG
jgi:excinuclease ABC subunit A